MLVNKPSAGRMTHVIIMFTPDIVRELMAEHTTDITVRPEAVVLVRSQTQFDGLSGVYIETKQFRVLVRCELGEEPDRELMDQHDMVYCRIRREPTQEIQSRGGVR
jgi:hypothetical protein